MSMIGNHVYQQWYRGFESRPLRQIKMVLTLSQDLFNLMGRVSEQNLSRVRLATVQWTVAGRRIGGPERVAKDDGIARARPAQSRPR